ncbi:DNA polymerase III subunit gamma and tau [Brachybacterium sp. GCM10030267]|uniref:DNA polymerase III subunit gamma and tau n=1 Tax=unclassified Brachybacterium TaxID=2623841 RepID=UPI00361999EC
MATALYRRYRPESFAEVIGQDHVTTPLRRALRAGRIGHAYLFSGPRGCGKTTSARILARCLNCAEGPTDTPCGQCDSCRDLARGGSGSLDVVEIDAASHGGVDDARELRERASFAPVRDRYKVFIIDEAHMVTSAGFNALLKLVEEPPEHVKFVFATTEPDKVIGTIRSRTHHYPFRLIPPQVLAPYLDEVCAAEGVQVGEGVMPLVVRAGGGSARDSLSVLDQLMAGAGEDGLDFPTAIALLGFTDTALLDTAITAVAQRDAASLYEAVEHVLATGHEPRRFVEDVLERMRDLIVLAAVPDRGADLLPQVPADELERMRTQAGMFAPADLSVCGDLVHETLSTMSGATSPRLHLELLAARLVLRDERAAAPARADGQAPAEGRPASAPPGQGGQAAAGPSAGPTSAAQGSQPAPAASGGREEARRIAQEKVEAARQARSGNAPSQAASSQAAGERPDSAVPGRQPAPGPGERQNAPAAREGQAAARPDGRSAPDGWDSTPSRPAQSDRDSGPSRPAQGGGDAQPSRPAQDGWDAQPSRPSQTPVEPRAAAQQAAPPAAASTAEAAANSSGVDGRAQGIVDAATVREHWSAILDELAQIRRPSWVLVAQNAHVNSMNGSTLLVGFRTEGLVAAFRRGTVAQNVADAVRRIMRVEVTVDAIVAEDPGPGGPGDGGPDDGGPDDGGGGGSGPDADGGPETGIARSVPAAAGNRWDRGRPEASAAPGAPGQERPVPSWGEAEPAMAPQGSAQGGGPPSSAPRAADRSGAGTAPARSQSSPAAPHARREGGTITAERPEDFPPEPDDPYPPDPEDLPPQDVAPHRAHAAPQQSAPPQRDPSAPAPEAPGPSTRWSDALAPAPAADVPGEPATGSSAQPEPGPRAEPGAGIRAEPETGVRDEPATEIPVVEDEGRDTLPPGQPRTYGQNALRRAIAEDRVVHSRPATRDTRPWSDALPSDAGAHEEPVAPAADDPAVPSPGDEEPAGAVPVERAIPSAGPVESPAPSATDSQSPAPSVTPSEPPAESASARAAASWGAAATVSSAPSPVSAPDRSAPSESPAAPEAQAPAPARTGAALAREAALASRTAGLRTRSGTAEPAEGASAPVDPTGGASRDDEDAVVATRNGREVIETVLGGKIIEVIDETDRY